MIVGGTESDSREGDDDYKVGWRSTGLIDIRLVVRLPWFGKPKYKDVTGLTFDFHFP